MNQELEEYRAYEYWLASMQGISDLKKRKLREYMKCAKDVYYIEETQLKKVDFLSEEEKTILQKAQKRKSFEEEWERIKEQKIWMYLYFENEYPEKLKMLTDCPYAIYGKGKLPKSEGVSIAIVGARKCTRYGELYAGRFAESLAGAGVQIISGMARGIDGAGHRGALMAKGKTFAVLGCGVDVCYPKEHKGLYMDILEHEGGILSEFPPGAQPLSFHFPRRNRIISGLSDGVLVIEAKEKSGSLITADLALEQGRDVWALPGPLNSELSRGCNWLIRQGAGILISPEILLEDLSLTNVNFLEKNRETKKMLERDEDMVYSSVGLYPKSIECLMDETSLSASEIIRLLVALEIKGYIKEISKNYYIRS